MRIRILMAAYFIIICAGCAGRPVLPDKATFYGMSARKAVENLEKSGLVCRKSKIYKPASDNYMDLTCTYLEKSWICPERYEISMIYDSLSDMVLGPAIIDRRKLCF